MIIRFVVIPLVLIMAIMALAYGRDLDGRYANSPHRDWINSLKNQNGMSCCDDSDGFRVDDPDWRNVGSAYEVRIEGKWMPLTDEQIITQVNRIGYAMVWIFRGRITCFMPGARG